MTVKKLPDVPEAADPVATEEETTDKSEQVFVKLFSKSLWGAGRSPATTKHIKERVEINLLALFFLSTRGGRRLHRRS